MASRTFLFCKNSKIKETCRGLIFLITIYCLNMVTLINVRWGAYRFQVMYVLDNYAEA
jgi:hypothetical protein